MGFGEGKLVWSEPRTMGGWRHERVAGTEQRDAHKRAQAALFPRYLTYRYRWDCPKSWPEGGSGPGVHAKGACIRGEGAKEGRGKQKYPSSSGRPSFSPRQVTRVHSNVMNHAGAMPGSLLPRTSTSGRVF